MTRRGWMEAVNDLTLASFLWMSHPTFSPFLSALHKRFLILGEPVEVGMILLIR